MPRAAGGPHGVEILQPHLPLSGTSAALGSRVQFHIQGRLIAVLSEASAGCPVQRVLSACIRKTMLSSKALPPRGRLRPIKMESPIRALHHVNPVFLPWPSN